MKNGKLPRGIMLTSAILGLTLATTGCDSVQAIIDDYNPGDQYEVSVYGPMAYVDTADKDDSKTNKESEKDNKKIAQGTKTKTSNKNKKSKGKTKKSKKIKDKNKKKEKRDKIGEYKPKDDLVTCDYGVIETYF